MWLLWRLCRASLLLYTHQLLALPQRLRTLQRVHPEKALSNRVPAWHARPLLSDVLPSDGLPSDMLPSSEGIHSEMQSSSGGPPAEVLPSSEGFPSGK